MWLVRSLEWNLRTCFKGILRPKPAIPGALQLCRAGTLIQWQPSVERKEHCTFRQFGASKTTQCDEKGKMREDGKRTCRGTPAICCFVLSRTRFDMSFAYEGYPKVNVFVSIRQWERFCKYKTLRIKRDAISLCLSPCLFETKYLPTVVKCFPLGSKQNPLPSLQTELLECGGKCFLGHLGIHKDSLRFLPLRYQSKLLEAPKGTSRKLSTGNWKFIWKPSFASLVGSCSVDMLKWLCCSFSLATAFLA